MKILKWLCDTDSRRTARAETPGLFHQGYIVRVVRPMILWDGTAARTRQLLKGSIKQSTYRVECDHFNCEAVQSEWSTYLSAAELELHKHRKAYHNA